MSEHWNLLNTTYGLPEQLVVEKQVVFSPGQAASTSC